MSFNQYLSSMKSPFDQAQYYQAEDKQLIEEAQEGSSQALEKLIRKHQHFIYNIALKMVLSPLESKCQISPKLTSEKDYAELFQKGPFQEKPHVDKTMATILSDKKVRATLNLN